MISPIKHKLVKKALLEGKSHAQAMLSAGYSPNTAYHNSTSDNKLLKTVQREIDNDIRKKITVESVLLDLKHAQDMAEKKQDIASYTKVCELLGKFLRMFNDAPLVNVNIVAIEERNTLSKYMPTINTDDKPSLVEGS